MAINIQAIAALYGTIYLISDGESKKNSCCLLSQWQRVMIEGTSLIKKTLTNCF